MSVSNLMFSSDNFGRVDKVQYEIGEAPMDAQEAIINQVAPIAIIATAEEIISIQNSLNESNGEKKMYFFMTALMGSLGLVCGVLSILYLGQVLTPTDASTIVYTFAVCGTIFGTLSFIGAMCNRKVEKQLKNQLNEKFKINVEELQDLVGKIRGANYANIQKRVTDLELDTKQKKYAFLEGVRKVHEYPVEAYDTNWHHHFRELKCTDEQKQMGVTQANVGYTREEAGWAVGLIFEQIKAEGAPA